VRRAGELGSATKQGRASNMCNSRLPRASERGTTRTLENPLADTLPRVGVHVVLVLEQRVERHGWSE